MFFPCISLFLLLPSLVSSQALPDLPDLPSPSPSATPSPLPSALSDLINPSPTRPTAVPAIPTNTPPANQPSQGPQQSQGPQPSPSPPTPPDDSPNTSNVPTLGPTISPTPNFINEEGVCERDMSKPRPKLGKSQRRYAIAVLASAAAVGIATLLYSAVHSWTPSHDVYLRPFFCIVAARILIFGAVRASAALVASITKASPNDSALDASGAFLTWASSIFTRLYNEGLIFTASVLDLINKDGACVAKLQQYFNGTRVRTNEAGDIPSIDTGAGQSYEENGVDMNNSLQGQKEASNWREVITSNWERNILCLAVVIYISQETTVLVVNVLTLVGSFEVTAQNFFSGDQDDGQCPLNGADVRAIFAVVILQSLYALTYQPSLVPLLSVGAFHNERWCFNSRWLRATSWLILLIWPTVLLLLPLLQRTLENLFLAGDMSLFLFVFIGPPTYTSPGFIITATYTCAAALIGAILIYRISEQSDTNVSKEAVP